MSDMLHFLHASARSLIASAAANGWTPNDLRHYLAAEPGLDHLLFSAADDMPGEATGPHDPWRTQIFASFEVCDDITVLSTWLEQLRTIRPLPGMDLLTDALQGQLADLTAAQRKAHDRITALMAKAESTTFSEEAEALLTKAQQLRQRYRIDEALAADQSGIKVRTSRVYLNAPWVRYQASLLAAVAGANSCRVVLLDQCGIAQLVGTPDDLTHVVGLFHSLNRQREWFMHNSPGAEEARKHRQTAAYRRSFQFSYATRISQLLHDANDDITATEEANSADRLPALAAREVAVRETFFKLFPRTGSMTLSSRHAGGYADGVAAANKSKLAADTEDSLSQGRREIAK